MCRKVLVFVLVICSVNSQITNENFSAPLYIDSLRNLYLSLEKAMWLLIRSGLDQSFVLEKIYQTHKTFFNEYFNEKRIELLNDSTEQKQLLHSFDKIRRLLDTIQIYYKNGQHEEQWLVDYAERGKYMTMEMDRIYNITNEMDFFQYVKNKGTLQNCNMSKKEIQSTSLMLYNYYTDISIYQLKAYVITQLSYMILTEYAKQNYVMQGIDLKDQFLLRSRQTQNKVYELMSDVNASSFMCDPDNFKLGENYDEVTRLLQGYVDNEVNLNPINDCKRTCEDHKIAKNYLCYNGTYCADKSPDVRCRGDVISCHYVGSQMTICPSPNDSNRRYDAISYDRGIYYGKELDECSTGSERAISWIRWFVQCSNCFCYCDEPGPKSDRYFSLRPVLTNTDKNMLVTGVALVKINRIFMWKIIEGQLIANGEVNKSTIHPKTGHIFQLDDTGIEDGVDYHTLSWKYRAIDLDTLIAPTGKVITGIRFNVTDGHLKLEIKASLFDFSTGKILDFGELDWIQNPTKNRTKLDIDDSHIPIEMPSKSVEDLNPDTFIEFGPTSEEQDVAQTTVPFIDTQFIQPDNPVPLSGIGIFYKGQPQSGGFIAPKIVTYDFRPHLLVRDTK